VDALLGFVSDEGLKLVIAVMLGGIIGFERELVGKPAGLRTNILIALGSTVLTIASMRLAGPLGDQGRIAAQIVSGVGFIGAGTIIQARGAIVGLTSAATIWAVAAIGIAIGADMLSLAIGATALMLLCLTTLRRIEYFSYGRRELITFRVEMTKGDGVADLQDLFAEAGTLVEHSSLRKTSNGVECTLSCNTDPRTAGKLLADLTLRDDVQQASFEE
jgi:putative Mg2+ transporter-C (MgtC) family protein